MKPSNEIHAPVPAALIQHIQQQPAQKITFHEYMELALYHPDFGSYQQSTSIVGKQGSFITAPEMTPLFAKALAHFMLPFAKENPFSIMELGPGNGTLAKQILTELALLGVTPQQYMLVETSASLRLTQQKLLQTFDNIVSWHSDVPTEAFSGFVLANEFFDALPVHRVRLKAQPEEWYVETKNQQLQWSLGPLSSEDLKQEVAVLLEKFSDQLTFPYDTEINLLQDTYLKKCAAQLSKGLILCIDYGFDENEYYHPDRSQGTLIGHSKHRVVLDPLTANCCDISAHVDFSRLVHSGIEASLTFHGYSTLAHFLLDLNLLSWVNTDNHRELQAVQTLLAPQEMGELFKVMALTKGGPFYLKGFQLRDLSYKL